MNMTGVTERAILAGGCFWGMQDLIRRFPGVVSTRVGYSGGDVPNATYRNHGTHAEAIEIIFEPEKTSFRDLLEFFFQIHDPSTKNRQGNDLGLSCCATIKTPCFASIRRANHIGLFATLACIAHRECSPPKSA
jgi:methionine-S-sulfoxide reductase